MFTTSYKYRLSVVAAILVASTLSAGQVGTLTNFEANTTAKASEVNHNFIILSDAVNDNDTRVSIVENNLSSLKSDITLNKADISTLGTNKQNRITNACGVGYYIRAINEDGSVLCQLDANTDSGGDITGVTAGYGLTGGGSTGTVTVNADTTVLQKRVIGACSTNYSIRAINSDGSVTCEYDTVGTGDITGVVAGAGLTGGGTSGTVTVGLKADRITVSHFAFHGNYPSGCFFNHNVQYGGYWSSATTGTTCAAIAPLQLPAYSTVTRFSCKIFYNDHDATATKVELKKLNFDQTSTSIALLSPPRTLSTPQDLYSDTLSENVGIGSQKYYIQFTASDEQNSYHDQRLYECTIYYAFQ